MADIRIDSLPVADQQRPQDMFALQRNVAGVWTDFRSNFAAMSGDVQIAIVDGDLSVNDFTVIYTPAVDELAVFITGDALYTPDNTPSGATVQLQIEQGVTISLMEFDSDAVDGGIVFTDFGTTNQMGTPLILSCNGAGNGTYRAMVQFVVVRV